MRASRMCIGNGFVTLVVLALCGACNMESWDWFGTKKKDDKPVTKARKPSNEPTVAAADRPKTSGEPKSSADDAKAKEVDDKVDRYVRNMNQNQTYDPNYEGNDFRSKMRRQNDPNRQERIRQTAARSKENQGLDGGEEPPATKQPRDPALAPTAKPAPADKPEEAAIEPETTTDLAATKKPEPAARTADQPATGSAKPAAKPVKTAPKLEDPAQSADEEPAPTPAEPKKPEPGRGKPPVLGEIKVTSAPPPDKPAESSAAPERTLANTPVVQTVEVDTFKKRLQEQEAVVARDVNNVEEQFKLRLMYLVNGQDDKATANAAGMNKETEEILLAQVRALMTARSSAQRDPAAWANKQLDAVEQLRSLVRSRADLRVPRVVLCKAIEGFGRYTPFEPVEFKAGKPNRVLIYIEVDNFTTEKTASGQYRVLLTMRQTLMSKTGEELWNMKDENIEDLARQPRRDFYLIADRTIPKTLNPGEYVIKVEVEDVLAGKLNSNSTTLKLVP